MRYVRESINKLFVYGIFLDQRNRNAWGMSNPAYDTVANYVTFGSTIVEALPVAGGHGVALTGLLVDVDPEYWLDIDRLEAGYDRKLVTTISGERAYMYVGKD